MKLITLSGGLGNQMFQYALFLQQRASGEAVFLYKNKIRRHPDHGGYALQRLFDVEQGLKGLWLTRLLLVPVAGPLLKHLLFPRKVREQRLYDYTACAAWLERRAWVGTHLVGYWQSERFFAGVRDEVRRAFTFDETKVSIANRRLAAAMRGGCSVSLHVRRGDYVSTGFSWMYGGICTPEYYCRAMQTLEEHVSHPLYYVFSDDLPWVREHLPLPADAVLVDGNTGADGWQDLFLMTCCRHHIVANSSFSWWGAYLGTYPDTIVVAPPAWVRHGEAPDILPDGWITPPYS